MKVYVDELPKDCWNCEFLDKYNKNYEGCYCAICQREFNDEDIYVSEFSFEHKKAECCPLQSLADHDKQVREEVFEEIRKLAINEFLICDEDYNTIYKDVCVSSVALTKILEQILSKDS